MFIAKLKSNFYKAFVSDFEAFKKFRIPFFLLWVFVSFQFLLRHEMWRDEVEGWLMVSNLDFFQWRDYLRHSGHPALFYLLVFPLAFFSLPIFSLQLFNYFVSLLATGVFFFGFRIPTLLKIFLLGGSFFLYRLPVFARNYSLGFLFLVLGILWIHSPNRKKRFLSYLSLLLLPQSHTLFVLIAVPLGLYFLLTVLRTNRLRKERTLFLVLLLFSGVIFLYTIFPKSEGQFQGNLLQDNPLVWRYVLPYAVFPSRIKSQGFYFLLWAFLGFFAFLLRANISLLFFYLLGTILFLGFFRFLYVAHLHHLIVFFFFLLTTLELLYRQRKRPKYTSLLLGLFYLSAFSQVQYLAKEDAKDWKQQFSGSRWAALALRDCGWTEGQKIASHPPDETKTILGYLPAGVTFAFPALGKEGSYMLWDKDFKNSYKVSTQEVEAKFLENKDWEYVVTNFPLSQKTLESFQICSVPPSEKTITKNEIFFPYRRKILKPPL